MPSDDYYAGLPLPKALRRLARHHHQRATRHISKVEFDLLIEAAKTLERGSQPVALHQGTTANP